MPSNTEEVVAPVDVDGMSDEELDSFIEEATGVDMNEPTDVVDDDTEVVPVDGPEEEEEIPLTEEVEEVTEELPDEESISEAASGEPDGVTPNVSSSGKSDLNEERTVSMDGYSDTELAVMTEVYEDLFKNGIKAAGVDRTVRDPEHLKTLVRIGLGANENNRKIKPYLKQLKSLEQAGVSLEDDNLNFLVDVMNGNKDAIKELVKNKLNMTEDELQSWYDDEDGGKKYIPNDHVISDSRFQLQEILDEIKTTPTYDRTVNFLGSIDDDGKVLISENPELVKLLSDDMQSGAFDKAIDEAQFRMDRGLLPKQSILQSYIAVMQDVDFYNSLTGVNPEVTTEVPAKATPSKKEVVSRKRRASNVGTSKGSTSGSQQHAVNTKDIKKMSDEEFDAFYDSLDMDD